MIIDFHVCQKVSIKVVVHPIHWDEKKKRTLWCQSWLSNSSWYWKSQRNTQPALGNLFLGYISNFTQSRSWIQRLLVPWCRQTWRSQKPWQRNRGLRNKSWKDYSRSRIVHDGVKHVAIIPLWVLLHHVRARVESNTTAWMSKVMPYS